MRTTYRFENDCLKDHFRPGGGSGNVKHEAAVQGEQARAASPSGSTEMQRGCPHASGVRRLVGGLGVVGVLQGRLGFLAGQQRRRLEAGESACRRGGH